MYIVCVFYSFQFGYGVFRINEFRTRNQIARSGVAPDYGCFELTISFSVFHFFFFSSHILMLHKALLWRGWVLRTLRDIYLHW